MRWRDRQSLLSLIDRHREVSRLIRDHLELGKADGFMPRDILIVASREGVKYNVALLQFAVGLGIESLGQPSPEVLAMERIIRGST